MGDVNVAYVIGPVQRFRNPAKFMIIDMNEYQISNKQKRQNSNLNAHAAQYEGKKVEY